MPQSQSQTVHPPQRLKHFNWLPATVTDLSEPRQERPIYSYCDPLATLISRLSGSRQNLGRGCQGQGQGWGWGVLPSKVYLKKIIINWRSGFRFLRADLKMLEILFRLFRIFLLLLHFIQTEFSSSTVEVRLDCYCTTSFCLCLLSAERE